MTDHEGQDHWGLLASNLGIEPHEQAANSPAKDVAAAEKEVSSETPVGPAPQDESALGVEAKAYVKKPPRSSRTADDWARLASGLGVELPPEESGSPAVPETPVPVPEPAAEPVVEKIPEQPSAEPEVVAEQWTESVIELMEESLDSTEPGIQEPVTPQPTDERRPERRRRRRRRRSRRPAEGQTAGARAEGPRKTTVPERGDAASEVEAASPEQHLEEEEFPGETAAQAPVEGEPQPGRSSRRRRRRGGDRRRDHERPDREGGAPAKVSPEVAASEVSAAKPSIVDERSTEEVTPAEPDDELGEEFDEDRTDKDGHRAIPSWGEAVAYIVERNMEARARKPDSGSSRSRGRGRGRGRD